MMEPLLRKLAEVHERARESQAQGWSYPDPGASEAELQESEGSMGRELPSKLKELLRFSRGWMWRERGFDAVIFQPPEDIAADHFKPDEAMDKVVVSAVKSDRVQPYYYSSKRVTIAFSDYFKFQIDEDPTSSGISGQIVVIDTEEETINVIADSLEEFVSHGIKCLEGQLSGGYPNDVD